MQSLIKYTIFPKFKTLSIVRRTLDLLIGFQGKRRLDAIKCKTHPDFRNFKM
jgi:hypothetical protein